jgi:hypothetical protein
MIEEITRRFEFWMSGRLTVIYWSNNTPLNVNPCPAVSSTRFPGLENARFHPYTLDHSPKTQILPAVPPAHTTIR